MADTSSVSTNLTAQTQGATVATTGAAYRSQVGLTSVVLQYCKST